MSIDVRAFYGAGAAPESAPSYPARATDTISAGTLTTTLDGGADTVQLTEDVATWTVSLPSGGVAADYLYSATVTFAAPGAGGPFVAAIPTAWLQMGSLDAISLSAGDAPIDVVLYTGADGVVRYAATQGVAGA